MLTFLIIGAVCALVPIGVGFAAFVKDLGFEWTFLGYGFLALAAYCDFLGCLWEVTT